MNDLKDQVASLVQNMPVDATLDDIFAELYFKAQVDAVFGSWMRVRVYLMKLLKKGCPNGLPYSLVSSRGGSICGWFG